MNFKISSIFLIFFVNSNIFSQNTWYVDFQNGANTNNGTSFSSSVKTIDYLTINDLLQPSDTVLIIGQYNNTSYNPNFTYGGDSDRNNPHIWNKENTIKLNNLNGAENQYITFKPYNNTTILKGDGANILRITNSSYLRIEGLEIFGEVENIPLSTAEGISTDGLQFLYLDASTVDTKNPTLSEVLFRVNVGTSLSTIENATYINLGNVIRPSYTDTRGLYVSASNHIKIINNIIHHTAGGGLRVSESSNIDIVGNEIYECSRRSYSGTHALVVTKSKEGIINSTDDSIYSIKIKQNIVRDNYNEIFSWAPTKTIIVPRIDEGKGISLQRNNLIAWQNSNKRILVENNLCYWNGFSGVHSNDGWHVDFINNTCFMNSYTNTVTYENDQKGKNIGISTSNGSDVRIINNISVIDADWNGFPISSNATTNLMVEDNIIFATNGTVTEDEDVTNIDVNTTISEPLFTNSSTFDFNILQNSPTIDIANSNFSPIMDFNNNTRDYNPDIGAFEFIKTVIEPEPTSISEINDHILEIYPNPIKNKFFINQKVLIKDISIFNTLGQFMNKYISIINHEQKTEINTTLLSNGLYYLKINNTILKINK